MTAATSDKAGPLGEGILDMALDLLDRVYVDQRSLADAILETATHLHGICRVRELAGELVVDALLRENPIGTDTGLTRIPVFRQHRAGDGRLDVGVVKLKFSIIL